MKPSHERTSMDLSLSGVSDTFIVVVDCMSSSNSRRASSSWVKWRGGGSGEGRREKCIDQLKAPVARKLRRLYHHLKRIASFGIVVRLGNFRRFILFYRRAAKQQLLPRFFVRLL